MRGTGTREGVITESAALMAPAPRFAQDGPEAEEYGASDGFPTGDRTTFFAFRSSSAPTASSIRCSRAASYGAPTRRRGWRARPRSLSFSTTTRAQPRAWTSTLRANPATGLLVARGDTILIERYQYGRNDRHSFTSWSMAKTVTRCSWGSRSRRASIRSVDDQAAAYVPGSPTRSMARTSLRHLLQMSSGVRLRRELFRRDRRGAARRRHLPADRPGGVEAVAPVQREGRACRHQVLVRLGGKHRSWDSSCETRSGGRWPSTSQRRSGDR